MRLHFLCLLFHIFAHLKSLDSLLKLSFYFHLTSSYFREIIGHWARTQSSSQRRIYKPATYVLFSSFLPATIPVLVAQMVKNPPAMQETWVGSLGQIPGSGRSPGEGKGNPLQYSCLENPYGHRSLAGYSPWGRKESDRTEQLSTAHPCSSVLTSLPLSKDGKEIPSFPTFSETPQNLLFSSLYI